jgi:hypothetical protein
MAVRFAAEAQTYSRTVALGSQSAYSAACWIKLTTDRNTWQTGWCLGDAAGGDVFSLLQTSNTGTNLEFITSASFTAVPIVNMTVGTWYFVGITMNGATGSAVYCTPTSGFTTVAIASQGAIVHQTLQLGRSIYSGEWLDGCMAGFKWWGATLSVADLQQEAWTHVPNRTSGLRAWYPLMSPETVDYSGSAATLSGGTGATKEDGPPVSWGNRRASRPLVTVAPAASGFSGWGVPAF